MRDSLTIETAFLAKSVEKIIQIRPDMWEWEVKGWKEIVSQPSLLGSGGKGNSHCGGNNGRENRFYSDTPGNYGFGDVL